MNKKEKTNKLEGNKDGKVWKKWWFWALIAAVVIGGVIENTEPETAITGAKESEKEKRSDVEKQTQTEKSTSQPIKTNKMESKEHIYNNAIIKDIMNGIRSEKIGEYSIIEIKSDQINEEIIADWYFNYVEKNDFNWNMILYTDRENEGIYANSGIINKDVTFDIDEYGDYSLGDCSNCITYAPDSKNTLKQIQ